MLYRLAVSPGSRALHGMPRAARAAGAAAARGHARGGARVPALARPRVARGPVQRGPPLRARARASRPDGGAALDRAGGGADDRGDGAPAARGGGGAGRGGRRGAGGARRRPGGVGLGAGPRSCPPCAGWCCGGWPSRPAASWRRARPSRSWRWAGAARSRSTWAAGCGRSSSTGRCASRARPTRRCPSRSRCRCPGGCASATGRWRRRSAGPARWRSRPSSGSLLTVRAWREGDRMRPVGLGGTKTLQDLFTDRKVPRALRHTLPVVVSDERDRLGRRRGGGRALRGAATAMPGERRAG